MGPRGGAMMSKGNRMGPRGGPMMSKGNRMDPTRVKYEIRNPKSKIQNPKQIINIQFNMTPYFGCWGGSGAVRVFGLTCLVWGAVWDQGGTLW